MNLGSRRSGHINIFILLQSLYGGCDELVVLKKFNRGKIIPKGFGN